MRQLLPCCLLAICATETRAQDWLETTISIRQQVEAGDYAAAQELGSGLIERATAEFGEISEQVAESYLIMAEVQFFIEDFFAAEDSVIAAIDVYGQLEGPLSTSLITPYSALGDTYFASREYDLAARAFEEARGISRRAYGLYNSIQIPLIYRSADAIDALGDVNEARELQAEALRLVQRNYGEASVELLSASLRLAGWLSEREFYREAGDRYVIAQRLLRAQPGAGPLDNVRILRRAADNYRLAAREFDRDNRVETDEEDLLSPEPGPREPTELENALDIVQRMDGDHTELEAELWRDRGDWYVAFEDYQLIEDAYLRAWNLLSGLENRDELIEEWFAKPVPVYSKTFRADPLRDDEDAPTGYVELQFDVSAAGGVSKVEVLASEPEGLVDREARRHVSLARFRPALEDGRAVPATRIMRIEFGYNPRYAPD